MKSNDNPKRSASGAVTDSSARQRPHSPRRTTIPDPYDRLWKALPELYGWYRSSEARRANLLRDLAVLPPAIRTAIDTYTRTVAETLDSAWPRTSRLRRAAIAHAVGFATWQSLAHEGLSDSEAAKLMSGLISTATAG